MIILITNWRAARRARDLAEATSPDPLVRARARIRSLQEVVRREQRAVSPVPAEVLQLDTRVYESRLRARVRAEKAERLAARRDGGND
jgi:hypothetical protein